MLKAALLFLILGICGCGQAMAAEPFERDVIRTSAGNLEITFIGHGSLMFKFSGKVVYVDPYGKLADYGKMPKADLVFLTHEHPDHLDPVALRGITGSKTVVVLTEKCAQVVAGGIVMKNGEARTVEGIKVEAVPAYNPYGLTRPARSAQSNVQEARPVGTELDIGGMVQKRLW